MTRPIATLAVAVAQLLVAPQSAAALSSKELPARTEAIFVTPPSGWVVSAWGGGTVELAEFTPPGQIGGAYIDLLGYSVVPRLPGRNDNEAQMRAFERTKGGCQTVVVRDHANASGWYDSEYMCLGRKDASPDTVEIEFASSRLGKQSVFRVWRSWRGSPTDLTHMLKDRFGLDLAPVRGAGAALTTSDTDLKAAFTALAPAFFADVDRKEICDLSAPRGCNGLHAAVPADLADTRPTELYIAGFLAPSLHRISREDFRAAFKITAPDKGDKNRVIAALLSTESAWLDPDQFAHVLSTVSLGQAADGGALYLVDRAGGLNAAGRTLALARLLSASRQLWQIGYVPNTIMVLGQDRASSLRQLNPDSITDRIPFAGDRRYMNATPPPGRKAGRLCFRSAR